MKHKMGRQLTLRGIPDRLYQELESEAKRQRASLNKVLLRRLSPQDKRTEGACAALLALAGTWDQKRAKDFEAAVEGHRSIDREIWS